MMGARASTGRALLIFRRVQATFNADYPPIELTCFGSE